MKAIGAVLFAFILIVAVIGVAMCTSTVPAGYVAVQYNMNGGIQDDVLTQGWHIVSPAVKTTLYSVGLEQSYLTAGNKGDSKNDESFFACSSEGKDIKIDLTFTYQYEAENVVDVFKRFKGQSGNDVRDNFIKPNIVSWTKEVIAKHKVADILGAERGSINIELTDYLAKKFEPYGITVSNVSLINVDVDEETSRAINAKIAAQQNAETQAINDQTSINTAAAKATVMTTEAQAKADALLIEANARAEANSIIQKSITKDILQSEWISKWNGSLPSVTGGGNDNILFGMRGVID